jgi:hypothetical protein
MWSSFISSKYTRPEREGEKRTDRDRNNAENFDAQLQTFMRDFKRADSVPGFSLKGELIHQQGMTSL